jgi:predicted nucleotidyltransferase
METKAILNKLNQAKPHFFKKYPLKSMGLFGSYARYEASEKSDIDIMVEFSRPVGFEIVDLALELEDILKEKVDLVSKNGIKSNMLPYIEKDIIYV